VPALGATFSKLWGLTNFLVKTKFNHVCDADRDIGGSESEPVPARHRSFRNRPRLFVLAAGFLGPFPDSSLVSSQKEQNHENP